MITLITGLPGNGKTLYAISWLKDKSEKENRDVYFSGIADLKLPWVEADPQKWFELPVGSIVVIDEVQRVMRPRMHGSAVPEMIAKLETHRHLGVDLVLITQHPMLLDSNVRRLVGQHFHVVRKFGTTFATVHEWNAVKDTCDKNREDSIRHEWRYPKDVFALYKSAEMHTVRRRIPMKVWLLLALPLVLIGIAWKMWDTLNGKRDPVEAQPLGRVTEGRGLLASPGRSSAGATVEPAQSYLDRHVPRVAGLEYTAPAYDDITAPTVAPFPAACVVMAADCRCYTQQATRLDTPVALCRSIVERGFFLAWQQQDNEPARAAPESSPAPAAEPQPQPQLASLGNWRPVSAEPVSVFGPDTGPQPARRAVRSGPDAPVRSAPAVE